MTRQTENLGPGAGAATPHLPALGRRGGGWVVAQMTLLGVAAVAGVAGPAWPAGGRRFLRPAAAPVALAGLLLLAGGGARLGRQLTVYPRPVATGTLRRDGAYGLVRHPMYGGVSLLLLAWALASSPAAGPPWAMATIFLDVKRRREEEWLLEQHADYAAYRRDVKRRLIPFVW
ncbi:MAG TPA: methyltransferase [Thermoleophilia bacterium]|nr:methyltransferase [Thermoleophilia bacterium]